MPSRSRPAGETRGSSRSTAGARPNLCPLSAWWWPIRKARSRPRWSTGPPEADPRNAATAEHPGVALHGLGLTPRRALSQSFLTRPDIASAMVEAADLEPTSHVIEIGPGLGVLTQELIGAAGQVTAIEIDRALAAALPQRMGNPANLRVLQADALRANLADVVAEPFVVVASLPYHVATPILFKLLFEKPHPLRTVVMLQEEVARRIVPLGPETTYLGIAFGLVATARIIRRVPPGAFHPVPKVHSAIVRLDRRAAPLVPPKEQPAFLHFLRAGFTQPRKQLHNSLGEGAGHGAAAVRQAAAQVGIDSRSRPGSLGTEEWIRLFRVLTHTPAAP